MAASLIDMNSYEAAANAEEFELAQGNEAVEAEAAIMQIPPRLYEQWTDLKHSELPFLISVGELYIPTRTVTNVIKGDIVYVTDATWAEGPVFCNIVLNAGNECALSEDIPGSTDNYPQDLRMRLEISSEGPPRVFILSTIQHFQVQRFAINPQIYSFYTGSTLVDFVTFLYRFIRQPNHPCATCDQAYARAATRNKTIQDVIDNYVPHRLHAELFDLTTGWQEAWFAPECWAALQTGTPSAWREIMTEISDDIYTFPMFSDTFCELICEELENFQLTGLPAARPNSMNNYGLVINSLGFEPMIDLLQEQLKPLFIALYPHIGIDVDTHHTFTVQYKPNQDRGLDMHTDDSHITMNVSLLDDFTGAALSFCGVIGKTDHRQHRMDYDHVKGTCLIHLGTQRHGAQDIVTGERVNLIIWNRSSTWGAAKQSQPYNTKAGFEAEQGPPSIQCLSYTHDRDYLTYLPYPEHVNETTKVNPWCPPPWGEYPGFETHQEQENRIAANS